MKKSWKEVSIKEYKEIEEITKREYDSPLEKDIAICAVLNGMNEDAMYELTVPELRNMIAQLDWMKKPFDFDKNWHPKKMTINGTKCKVFQSIESLSVAQYLDFETLWDKRDENMGKILSVFIVPEGKKYNEGYDLVQFQDELERTLSITDWNAFFFSFLKSCLYSLKASITYSAYQITREIWRTKDKTQKKELRNLRSQMLNLLRHMRF